MTKERIFLYDTALRCPPCPQAQSGEDRQNIEAAVASLMNI